MSAPSIIRMQSSKSISDLTSWETLLPVELMELILIDAWAVDLCPKERINLFTSICLVNRTFLAIFIRIALTDVHITSSRYAGHYLRLLRTRSPHETNCDFLLPDNASQTANALCRRITFHVDARAHVASDSKPAIKLYSAGDRNTRAISSTLYMLDLMKEAVPNLRAVAIEYTDWGFDDIFDQNRLMPLPRQVTDLTIRFRFSSVLQEMRTKASGYGKGVLEDLRRRYEQTPHPFGRFATPHVRRLTVLGATTAFAAGMLEACCNAETVVFDEYVELPAVPPWIRTVVIREPEFRAKKKGEVRSQNYTAAARSVSGGRGETCTKEMMALLYPVLGQDHDWTRKRLKTYCEVNRISVVEA